MKCIVCDREADESVYCKLHTKAYENIVERYELWKTALEICWKDYLKGIIKNTGTGEWAKEVASHLVEKN